MPEDIDNNTSLYVGNVHPYCDEATLFDKFSALGPIVSVKVCKHTQTGLSPVYAFVNYFKHEDAKKALDDLNCDLLYGLPLRVTWAFPNRKSKVSNIKVAASLMVKNLPKTIGGKVLKDLFSTCGTVLSVKLITHAFADSKAIVQFEDENSAKQAISEMQGAIIHGRKILVSEFLSLENRKMVFPNNVFVKNLTPPFSGSELEEMCLGFGNVESVKVVMNEKMSKGYGFVSFESRDAADRAIVALNTLCINGNRISASIAKNFKKSSSKKKRKGRDFFF